MNEQNVKEKSKEYFRIEQLVIEGEHNEAVQLIDNFKKKGEYTPQEILLYKLLECDILFQQALYEDVAKLAEQVFIESMRLGENLLSIESLLRMAGALIWLFDQNKAEKIIKKAEELLNTIKQEFPIESKQIEGEMSYVKSLFFTWAKIDPDKALKHLDHSIKLYTEYGPRHNLARSFVSIAWVLGALKGELERALKCSDRALLICKEKNYKIIKTTAYFVQAALFSYKGDLDHSNELYEQCIIKYKELNNKFYIAASFSNMSSNYLMKGDLNRALESAERALSIFNEIGALGMIVSTSDFLIKILIELGDTERAQQILERMELIKNQFQTKQHNRMYLFDKALILKTSPRARNRGMAEEIFNQILKEEDLEFEIKLGVLLNLCELLVIELQMLNDVDILGEIEFYITQLIELAEKSHSYILLAEIYYLKGKLALLDLDMKKSRRFLTQAQRIAERWNFLQLATKIYSEHKILRNQEKMWEELKDKDLSLKERIKLAGLDEQMDHLLRRRRILSTQVKEEEVTIHREKKVCIVCKGDVLGFMYTCKCDAIYCENCALALADLENVCWVCNLPIGILKPTKPYKEEKAIDKEIIKKNP